MVFAGMVNQYTFAGDNTPSLATSIQLAIFTSAVTIDTVNDLVYIADAFLHVVRVIDRKTNIISTFAGDMGHAGSTGDGGRNQEVTPDFVLRGYPEYNPIEQLFE
jgi:hypothetical protein